MHTNQNGKKQVLRNQETKNILYFVETMAKPLKYTIKKANPKRAFVSLLMVCTEGLFISRQKIVKNSVQYCEEFDSIPRNGTGSL